MNRRLRLKMDCKKSSFSAARARTCTHNHTLSSLHGSCFAASASIPIIPQCQLRPSDQIPTADAAFTPQLPVPRFTPLSACLPPRSSSPVWELWPTASAGLSPARAHRLFCCSELTNRWRATFPPVKCKCYKVQHHVGRV